MSSIHDASRGGWLPARIFAKLALGILLLSALFYVATAIQVVYRAYSAIPFWDMWRGYIGFFMSWQDGDVASWWHSHNEHRIVLAKLLFWLDLELLHGSLVLLLVANFVFLAATALLFAAMLRRLPSVDVARAMGLAIVCPLFSLMQIENLTWGFQVAFFLAQLVPLGAFYLLYLASIAERRAGLLFAGSAALGFLGIGTMANGVLALPLLAVLAALLRLGVLRVAILLGLSAAAASLYFFSEPLESRHEGLISLTLALPVPMLRYTLAYLGSPFFYISSAGAASTALVAGAIFTVLAAGFFVLACRDRAKHALALTLLLFIAYVGATAFATGTGRMMFGPEQAVSSRYTSAALTGWCALLVVAASFLQHRARARHIAIGLAVAVALTWLPRQWLMVGLHDANPFERQIAGLALEMGVRDDPQVGRIYRDAAELRGIAEPARMRRLSAFGRAPLAGIRERIGRQADPSPAQRCQAQVDSVAAVAGDERYLVLKGWIYRPDVERAPHLVSLVDGAGRLVGYGFSGELRSDLRRAHHVRDRFSGFRAYLLSASYADGRVSLLGREPDCSVEIQLPARAD